ncbi:MAG: hypothetical protein NUW24_05790 [Anaerolineae bacterium]|jgi:hypothetical protein|nr:hypothetical protein [Anaerolineae bacterium]
MPVPDPETLIHVPHTGNHTIFLEGPAGAGKTTLAVQRLRHLLSAGVPGENILVWVPQRTLAGPYYQALRTPDLPGGALVDVVTIGGLARRMVDLFWPLIAEQAGFDPTRPPTFLTLETAQYYMARVVEPALRSGAFDGVTIAPNRLVSQIIDNLNKAAVVGFPVDEIAQRLKEAWAGESSRLRIFDQAQACALRFRQTCLQHNLLDFSLQIEVFVHHLWPLPLCRYYLLGRYRHLIVDNVEEDVPVAHDLLWQWLPECDSALVVYDRDAGYRVFLGADPDGGYALRDACHQHVSLEDCLVASPDVQALAVETVRSSSAGLTLRPRDAPTESVKGNPRAALEFATWRYHPQMLDWVADEISRLVVHEGVPPGEIAVLAPFLGDALRFSLTEKLKRHGIPVRAHRPSRALREEPAVRCLLTLAAIAHPAWGRCPSRFDVAYALQQAIHELDLVRAQLLTDIVYHVQDGAPALRSFDPLIPEMQQRITYLLGGRYEELRRWLEAYAAQPPVELDHFFSRLFGEVLSQPGFGFHHNLEAGEAAAKLIESARKFRQTVGRTIPEVTGAEGEENSGGAGGNSGNLWGRLGQEYVDMVERGVLAAQYVPSWQISEEAVFLAPAYTFLTANRPVDIQFWINAGSQGWWRRINQPLTHPYVLSRSWPRNALWTESDEMEAQQTTLCRLVLGLLRRCRKRLYLGLSEIGEQGYEELHGPLPVAIQRVLRANPND